MDVDFRCAHFQLDNQMFDLGSAEDNEFNKAAQKYDFPVIFIPRERRRSREKATLVRNYFQSLDFFSSGRAESSFLRVKTKFCALDPTSAGFGLVHLDVDLKPFDVYFEDYLIYNLAEIGLEFFELASSGRVDRRLTSTNISRQYQSHELDLSLISRPLITMSLIRISRVDALVSLQTSLKIYMASYKMPIVFDEFNVRGMPVVLHSSPQIVKQLTSHYLTSLLFRAGWLLGSLELIGSPTAFVQQVIKNLLNRSSTRKSRK